MVHRFPGVDFRVFPLSLEFVLEDTRKSIILLLVALVCLMNFESWAWRGYFYHLIMTICTTVVFNWTPLSSHIFIHIFILCVCLNGWVGGCHSFGVKVGEQPVRNQSSSTLWVSSTKLRLTSLWLVVLWLTHTAIPALILGKGLLKECPFYKSTNYA